MSDATLTRWARLLFSVLRRAGAQDVVVSPGSRSTPFAWAALNTPGLVCHSVLDERCAGFFALGQARVSGRASVLLCTSGSAAAQYLPAVVEASHAYLPLLIVTADRPFELMDVAAAQTMDQAKLYGSFVRQFFELGHPEDSSSGLDGLERIALQAAHLTRAPIPGPVHLNARARKPLEPVLETSVDPAFEARLSRAVPRQYWSSRQLPAAAALEALVTALQTARRGLLLAGPGAAAPAAVALPGHEPGPEREAVQALFDLASASGFVLCAETTSQLRHAPAPPEVVRSGGFEALLGAQVPGLTPDFVLCFGAPPTTPAFSKLFTQGVPYAVVAPHGFPDPDGRASSLIAGDAGEVARDLTRALSSSPAREPAERRTFRERWRRADEAYFRVVERLLARESQGALTEGTAVRMALDSLPEHALLGLGNSLPVRDVDSFVPPSQRALRVWSQRGLNGIDGLVSGAAGAAMSAQRASLALLGDVSFAHDMGGLQCARQLQTPLVLCVIDNAGGRIFRGLPIAATLSERPELETFWLTPPRLELSHLARAFGLAYFEANDATTLRTALTRALDSNGATIVRACVEPDSARELRVQVRQELSRVLE